MSNYPPRQKAIKRFLSSKTVYQCSRCHKYASSLIREQKFRPGQRDNLGEISRDLRVEADYRCEHCGTITRYNVSWHAREKYWIGMALFISKERAEEEAHLARAGLPKHDPLGFSAYSPAGPQPSKNPYIRKWWTPAHDELLKNAITKHGHLWDMNIHETIINNTLPEVIDGWRERDPKCQHTTWHNVLTEFAKSRAEHVGLTRFIPPPCQLTCMLCNNTFLETHLSHYDILLLERDRLQFCPDCLGRAFSEGNNKATRTEIKQYLQDLATLIGRVPTSQVLANLSSILATLSDEDRATLLQILQRKPHYKRMKKLYGSWFHAIIDAGLLADGTRRTSRGTHTLAKDGHFCLSLAEKTIDDYLYDHGIPHEREVFYPGTNYRADFKVGNIRIEYFGLTGDANYDEKTRAKIQLCQTDGIALIELYPADLVDTTMLDRKLDSLFARVD